MVQHSDIKSNNSGSVGRGLVASMFCWKYFQRREEKGFMKVKHIQMQQYKANFSMRKLNNCLRNISIIFDIDCDFIYTVIRLLVIMIFD